ncbi:hypothetical protein [Actinoplanes sp. L3-i22]|uniref:hypothetical protein n=1 Tax=Actinoplanes sp. L3-i22 TaxID=2836373 RepID=UPI001C770706|nr:hypothetical protein [Actinoplanes sp. L3-i22]BCY07367.1 hypothetical protein L3i22_024550 [Actinoplanes sp. L3-i22]
MHNLDRTLFETGAQETGEYESEQEDFFGILGSMLKGESAPTGEYEYGYESEDEGELESAARLLEVRDEAELDRFLGDLFNRAVGAAKSAAGAARNFAGSPTGKALGGIVKKATKEALPVIGGGIGGWLSPDYAGAGTRAGTAIGDLLGLELEGLSNEDREFETARALIRFAQAACRNAAQAPPGAQPREVAHKAAVAAARQHAPGLLANAPATAGSTTSTPTAANGGRPAQPGAKRSAARSGRWIRQGNSILILEN